MSAPARQLALGLALLGLAAGGGVIAVEALSDHAPRAAAVVADEQAKAFAAVPLVGGDGATASLAQLHGSWVVLLYGYMSCPDVCPTSLAYLASELQGRADAAPRVRVAFVSVDPARDTPAALATYVHYFDQRFVAFTGTEANLRSLAKTMGAYFEHQEGGLVAHSSTLFILDPEGRLVDTVSPPFAKGMLGDALRKLNVGET